MNAKAHGEHGFNAGQLAPRQREIVGRARRTCDPVQLRHGLEDVTRQRGDRFAARAGDDKLEGRDVHGTREHTGFVPDSREVRICRGRRVPCDALCHAEQEVVLRLRRHQQRLSDLEKCFRGLVACHVHWNASIISEAASARPAGDRRIVLIGAVKDSTSGSATSPRAPLPLPLLRPPTRKMLSRRPFSTRHARDVRS